MSKRFFMVSLIVIGLVCSSFSFVVNSDEPPVVPEPFLYEEFVAPPSSFGMGNATFKTVNWSYFKELFNQHCDWMLEYKRYSYSDWTDGSSYMTIEKTWNESLGGWKFNLILDVPVDVYSARFTFGCSLQVLDYVVRDGWQVNLNYTIPGTNETYNCYFNWSDMASIPNIIFSKGIQDDIFWFRFRRDNIPSGHYEFDPTFGYETLETSGVGIGNTIMGAVHTMGGTSGTADNITVGLLIYGTVNVHCRIYDSSGNFVAKTEERALTDSVDGWETFSFSGSPSLTASTDYFLSAWAYQSYEAYLYYDSASGTKVVQQVARTYDYSDETSVSRSDWTGNYDPSIYCTYTVDESPPSNNNPTSSGESPTNSSTIATTAPSCQDLYVIVTDADADTMNATWHSNSSGSWVQFATNNSIANNTNITQCNSNFTTCETTYYWSINISDGMGGFTNDTFHFTTPSCPYVNTCPVNSSESPSNHSIDVSINVGYWNVSINDANDNNTYGNITCSNGNTTSWSDLANGTRSLNLSTLSYSTNYTVWLNFTDVHCDVNSTYWFVTEDAPYNNTCPTVSNFNVTNGSCCNSYPNLSWYFDVNDIDGNITSGTVFCNNTQWSNWSSIGNHTQYINLTNLTCGTTYHIWVNLSDDYGCAVNNSCWFNTTNCTDGFVGECNCTDFYTKEYIDMFFIRKSDSMEINIEISQLVMLMLLGCWLFFTALFYKEEKEIVIAWVQFSFAMPLSFIIGGVVASYTLGYAVAVIIPLLSLVILADAYYTDRKQKKYIRR